MEAIICIGNSNSGKTTFSEKFVLDNPDWIVLSKDNLRRSLFVNYRVEYWRHEDLQKREQLIDEMFFEQVQKIAKLKQFNVIVDTVNSNLNFFKKLTYCFYFNFVKYQIKYFDVPLEILQERAVVRDNRDINDLNYLKVYDEDLKIVIDYCKKLNLKFI